MDSRKPGFELRVTVPGSLSRGANGSTVPKELSRPRVASSRMDETERTRGLMREVADINGSVPTQNDHSCFFNKILLKRFDIINIIIKNYKIL